MNQEKTYQEIFFILEQGKKDIRKCLEIIKKHGGEIQDIFRHYGVIGVVLPSCEISKVEGELRAHRIAVQIHHGVILEELEEESTDSMKYGAVTDGQNRGISKGCKQLLTEDIAIWYAYQFERQRIKKENLMPFLTPGTIFDIVTSEPAWDHPDWEPEYMWFPQFEQSLRLITVVGQRYKQPHSFMLPDIVTQEHSPKLGILTENDSYFVYYIYNLNRGSHPHLVILNSLFLKKHYKKCEWREIVIRNVAKGIKVNKMKIHILPRLTDSTQRLIKSFFHT